MANTKHEPVFGREIAGEAEGKIAGRSAVRVVFRDDRIEVVRRHISCRAGCKSVMSPTVLGLSECAGRVEAAAGKNGFSVQSLLFVAHRIDFDHASHLSPVFSGNASRVDGERVNIIRLHFWPETRGTVIGKGNSIDHKLGLILRASGMEDGVAFVEPAGLRVDQVDQGAARK